MLTDMKERLVPKEARIGWVDYAKTIAIYLVLLLHTYSSGELTVAIKSFVMPAFFFISGFLFSRRRNPVFGRFAYKRFRQLVVPYLWINALAYLAWVVVLRHYGNDAGSGIGWHEPLLAILTGLPPGLVHDIPLWSLLCFFVVEMVYYPLGRRIGDLWIAAAGYAVASAISLLAPDEGVALPFTLAPCGAALAFYALGHYVAGRKELCARMARPSVIWLLVAAVVTGIGIQLNIPTAFFMGALGNPLWFLLTAFGGTLMVTQVSGYLCRLMGDGEFIRFTSGGTLLICGFHLMMFAVIKGVMLFVAGIEPEELTAGVGRGLLMAAASFGLCLPVIWIVNKWMRWLVSK